MCGSKLDKNDYKQPLLDHWGNKGETMRYGSVEFTYAEPFANALVEDPSFRTWVLRETKFSEFADEARILNDEMMALRNGATTSWRSHYTEKCRCQGCSGQETDILAIFEGITGTRFALHFEVKHPRDKFPTNKDQAANYALRAKRWVDNPPQSVLPHEDAATVLLCSDSKLAERTTPAEVRERNHV